MTNAALVPANLPDISTARLPAVYEAASRAIAECERIDECKSWSDKAAALASYARQARDDSLRVMAVRIQARAERRCGVLLQQIPRADGSTRYGQSAGQAGADPPVTRTQAGADAGLSDRQRKTALRLAAIPEPEFDRQVESSAPPTVTRLAEQGKVARTLPPDGVSAHALGALAKGCEALTQFTRFCERNDPIELARAVDIGDIEAVSVMVSKADQWLDRFVAHLPTDLHCGTD